jgi:hypothetical protein
MNPNIQQGQIGQTQPNFSVPNRAPGRYIGGGEINRAVSKSGEKE